MSRQRWTLLPPPAIGPALLSCCVGLLAGLGCAEGGGTTPGLVVLGSEVHDFGKCRQGEVLAHTFSLINKSKRPIRIVELMSSCGCLVADTDQGPSDMTVAPNASFALPIRFTPGSAQETVTGGVNVIYHRQGESVGPAKRDRLGLRVRATVLPDYRISPRELDFGEIDGLAVQHVARKVRVRPEAVESLELRGVQPSSELITAQIVSGKDDDREHEIEVSLDLSRLSSSQTFNSSVVLLTDSKRLPKALVRVRAKYVAPAHLDPELVVIGSDQKGGVEREVRISTSRATRVRSASSSAGDRVRVEFDDRSKSREHLLRLIVPPCHGRSLNGEVHLWLEFFQDDGESVIRTLIVPVHRFSGRGD